MASAPLLSQEKGPGNEVEMDQILRCDWLPVRKRWRYFVRSGLFFIPDKKSFSINPFLTKLVWSRWRDISQVSISFRVYGPRRTSRLGHNRWSCALERREAGLILLVTKRSTINSSEESQYCHRSQGINTHDRRLVKSIIY